MRASLLLISFCLLARCACAQGEGDTGKAAAAPDGPAANPARPTITNPAHIPPPGYLQFEQGVLQANDSPGLDRQISVVQTTKLALTHYVMVQIGSQPVAHTVAGPGMSSNDTGDLLLGAQVLFDDKEEGRSHVPTFAALYQGRVRTGTSADLDIGSYSQGLTLLASGTNFGIHYDANLLLNEQVGTNDAGAGIRRAQYGQTLSLTRQLNKPFSVTGELWHFTQPLVFSTREGGVSARSNAVGVLVAGGYTVRPYLVIDLGFDHGLTSTSTAWQGFVGFTYLLPHRLWQGGRR